MENRERIQVQGLCRFSYPCTGGFKLYHNDLEERRRALYAPKRLDRRMVWFEHICLPGLRAQTDRDFTLHLLLGEDFPQPYRDRMMALIADLPQITAHFLPAMDHRAACRQVLLGGRSASNSAVAEFRLDDDDAVAVNFVQSLRRNWPRLQRLAAPNGRIALDHGKGFVIEADIDGVVTPHPVLTHAWAPGLAVFMPIDDTGTIMDFPHQRIWMRVPFVNLTDQIMMLRGDHGGNDARTPWAGTGKPAIEEAEIPGLLKRRFDIDLDAFTAAWQRVTTG